MIIYFRCTYNGFVAGALVVFGFAAILKYVLKIIGVATAAPSTCWEKNLHLVFPALQTMFVLGQVIFLFFYAKVNIHRFTYLSR